MSTDREAVLDHVYRLFYGDLSICGCGSPETAYVLVRDLLALAPKSGCDGDHTEPPAGQSCRNHAGDPAEAPCRSVEILAEGWGWTPPPSVTTR